MQNLSTGQAAAVLQVSRDTVRRLCEDGKLSFDRLGGQTGWLRVHRDSLEQYATQNKVRLNWEALTRR